MSPRKVALLTASSNSGRSCLEALLANPDTPEIHALFRTPERASAIVPAPLDNVIVHTGVDASVPSTLAKGLSGCEAALLVTPLDPAHGMANDGEKVCNMIQAAVDAKVNHIVFVSSWTITCGSCPILAARFRPGERMLRDLGERGIIQWTILRGGFFQSNYVELLKTAQNEKLSFFDFLVPANDPSDIGRVAAAVLLQPSQHHGKSYEIAGPSIVSLRDVLEVVNRVTGRNVQLSEISLEEGVTHLPPFLREAYEFIVAKGRDALPAGDDVFKVTGNKAVSFEQFVQRNRHVFQT